MCWRTDFGGGGGESDPIVYQTTQQPTSRRDELYLRKMYSASQSTYMNESITSSLATCVWWSSRQWVNFGGMSFFDELERGFVVANVVVDTFLVSSKPLLCFRGLLIQQEQLLSSVRYGYECG
jgi:hypothetical protein